MRGSELPIAWEQPLGHQAVLDTLQALLISIGLLMLLDSFLWLLS